jgi:hypothetical protein
MNLNAFDEILKFMNNLAENMDVDDVIEHSQIFWLSFNDLVASNSPANFGFRKAVLANSWEVKNVRLTEEEWTTVLEVID